MDNNSNMIISDKDMHQWSFCNSFIRMFCLKKETWFVAKDVASALEYRKATDLTRSLDPDEILTFFIPTTGGNQEMLVISEAGLYHAIFISRKESAKEFRRWVTKDVLPEIRKTGTYPFFDKNHFANERQEH